MKRTTTALPTSRIIVLRTLLAVTTAIIIGRFFQISVLDHSKNVAAAKNQYGVRQTIQAKRGKIFLRDLNGGPDFPIALNIDTYTVVADPFLIKEAATVAATLSPILQESTDDLIAKLSDQHKRFVVLKKKLTKDESIAIEKLNLKGITTQAIPSRLYPEGSLAAQVVGFDNVDGDGQAGIERFFNEDLKGYNGSLVGEKDAKRRIIAEGKSAQPKDGTNITLTIDRNIQYMVEQKLKEAMKKYEADGGSAVILDAKTAAVLAMATLPSFDPNSYGSVPADQQSVFINKVISTPWEPGSTFKPFTLAAGIDQGLFEPETVIDIGCSVKVNGFEIHNAFINGSYECYNHPTIIQVLTQSLNLGTIWAADKLGNDLFAKYVSDFGFGGKTGIELQPESNGKILPLKQWQDVNRATMSFGQGLSVTPLQLVAAYEAIANGGKLMRPFVVAKRVESDGRAIETQPQEVRQAIKPETAAKATVLLEKVVIEGHGKKAAVPGYKIAGKTGTAQVVGDNGKYEENQNIGSFGGFFPSNDPKFVMVVKLDRPKAVEFAESSAAPTFGEIAAWLLHYAKVPPTEQIN